MTEQTRRSVGRFGLEGSLSTAVRKMITGVLVLCVVCGAAIVGYLAAGWRLDDAIYMVVITIFGVGYGEVQPVDSWPLRSLTILVVVAGYGAVIYTIGGFIQMVVDGELNQALGVRRMAKDIDQLEGHVVVCGLGRMGRQLAAELHRAAKPFVAIDIDPVAVVQAEAAGYLAFTGDASDEDTLSRARIRNASVLAAALSDDAANVFVTLTARSMDPDLLIVARGENHRTESKLLTCGADQVVLPTAIGATKMSQLILRPTATEVFDRLSSGGATGIDVLDLGLELDQVEIRPGSPLADRTIHDLEVRGSHGHVVIGIRKGDGTTLLKPPADTALEVGDTLVVLGYENDLLDIAPRPLTRRQSITYRGAQVDM